MPSWADGEDKYMAAYRGESVDDAPARCRDCGDSFPYHCGECGCCREADVDVEPCAVCGHPEHAGEYCRGIEDGGCDCELLHYLRGGP